MASIASERLLTVQPFALSIVPTFATVIPMHGGLLRQTYARAMPALSAILCCFFLFAAAAGVAQQRLSPELEQKIGEGVQNLRSGDLDAAESIFSDVLRHGFKLPIVYHNLGVIAALRGNHTEAVTRFRQSLALQPTFPVAEDPSLWGQLQITG